MKEGLEKLFTGCLVYVLVILLVPALVGAAYKAIKDSPEIPWVPAPQIKPIPEEIACGTENFEYRYDGRFCKYTVAVKYCWLQGYYTGTPSWYRCMAKVAPANPAQFGYRN